MRSTAKILFFALLLAPALAFGQDSAIILNLFGSVEVRLTPEGAWQKAEKGMQVSDGSALRTGSDGRASLLFKNNSTVWLKENTKLDLQAKSPIDHLISLLGGSIKVRVPHLRWREKFNVRTPTALAAVRGTVFTADADDKGDLSGLDVLFGHVKLDLTDRNKHVDISQGNGFSEGKVSLLTHEREVLGLEDWSPGVPEGERRATLLQNLQKRAEIRQFAQQAMQTEREVSASAEQQKENDFAAGRTLVDVHGNVVRVDQRLDRPDNKTLEVLNVVKRTGYGSSGLRAYSYSGSADARLDALIAKVQFNQPLPDRINDLPGFLSSNKDTVKVDQASLVTANMTDPGSVYVIGFFGQRKTNSGTDDIQTDLYAGTLSDGTSTGGQKKLFNLQLDGSGNVAGLTHFQEVAGTRIENKGTGGELYENTASQWVQVGNSSNKVWLASENWVIDNNGKVRNVSDYTSGSNDFQSLLKNTAGEVAIFLKQDSSGKPNTVADATAISGGNSLHRNVDLVITPDLILSVIKTLATSGDTLKTTY